MFKKRIMPKRKYKQKFDIKEVDWKIVVLYTCLVISLIFFVLGFVYLFLVMGQSEPEPIQKAIAAAVILGFGSLAYLFVLLLICELCFHLYF